MKPKGRLVAWRRVGEAGRLQVALALFEERTADGKPFKEIYVEILDDRSDKDDGAFILLEHVGALVEVLNRAASEGEKGL